MKVGHIAAVFETEDAAHGRRRSRNFIPPEREHHAADKVHHEVASYTGTVGAPATPAGKVKIVKRNFWSIVEPSVPVERLRRQVWWWRVLPGAGWIVAAEREFNHFNVANRAAGIKCARLF